MVHQFCRVGRGAMVAGLARVIQDVPPYMMIVGNPPQPRTINAEGLRRRGFTAEQIRNIKEASRILYRSGLRLAEAQERIAGLAADQPELAILVEFLESSERGIFR